MSETQQTFPAIQLDKLTKTYDGTNVVDELSLTIPHGTTFGLIGANGAGKSTTLKMLMGILKITDGRAMVYGNDIKKIHGTGASSQLRQKVGYVPESHNIYRWMKVKEAIKFVSRFYENWNPKLCDEMQLLFELDSNKKVKQLSKGMLANLALLLAVCHEPDLLVLDEPMSGLDPIAREEFLDGVLRGICEREQTIILSSHSLDDVQRVTDTIGLLHKGKLLVHRPVDDILTQTKRIQVVLKDDASPDWSPDSTIYERHQKREWVLTVDKFKPDLVDQLKHLNSVQNLEVQDLSLEEVFKDYMKGQKAKV